MVDFEQQYNFRKMQVEEALTNCFNRKFDSPDNIVSAMKYSLFAGGKRIRPVLMIETCACFGGTDQQVMKLACAIEMIHTYSLIHDDLPAMDDDALRRGKPTNHKVYGEDIAILAGDALLNFAMETALANVPVEPSATMAYVNAMQKLFISSGVNGMIGGQTGDMLIEGDHEVNEAKLMYVYSHKTGALLESAIICGALVAGASSIDLKSLKRFAQNLGLIFQIVDDVLDIVGDEKSIGKDVGSDERNHKLTYVSLYGQQSTEEKIRELRLQAIEALDEIEADTGFLREILDFICFRIN